MLSCDIRKLFIDYFVSEGHEYVSSASLVPQGDDTLLFVNSGMVQFKNVFVGVEDRAYNKAISVQKCLRVGGKHNDIEQVGFTPRHHTFFEMLGNFSFGAYSKEQAILYAWDFLTKELQLDIKRLLITVFHEDQEAFDLWKKIANLPDQKLLRISSSDNFWQMSDTGPCGPSTEIFFDNGKHINGGLPGSAEEGNRFVEIWNLVFMQYNRNASGELHKLDSLCVDTGMGLERIAAVLQGKIDNYDTDIFSSIINATEDVLSVQSNQHNSASFKVIADHLRAISFMISDGIMPSNEGRGYILRRIIRRAIKHGYLLGQRKPFLYTLSEAVRNSLGEVYPQLKTMKALIKNTIEIEEEKFTNTFEQGVKILQEEAAKVKNNSILPGKVAFKMYDTYGFPLDMTKDFLLDYGLEVDEEGFDQAFKEHRALARRSWVGSFDVQDDKLWKKIAASIGSSNFIGYDALTSHSTVLAIIREIDDYNGDRTYSVVEKLCVDEQGWVILDSTPFYPEMGGQIGDSGYISGDGFLSEVSDTKKYTNDLILHKVQVKEGELLSNASVYAEVYAQRRQAIRRNHTVAHILHWALRKHLGEHVTQQGSSVDEYRVRFDALHNQALTLEQIQLVECTVNSVIFANINLVIEYMSKQQAMELGAMALFNEKYPNVVRTVKVQQEELVDSFELCGGTHVAHTGEIGLFKIVFEGSIASGVRRIEGVTGFNSLYYLSSLEKIMNSLSTMLSCDSHMVVDKVQNIMKVNKALQKSHAELKIKSLYTSFLDKFIQIDGLSYLIVDIEEFFESKEVRVLLNDLLHDISKGFILIFIRKKDTNDVIFYCGFTNNLVKMDGFNKLKEDIFNYFEAKGGGGNILQGAMSLERYNNLESSFIVGLVKSITC